MESMKQSEPAKTEQTSSVGAFDYNDMQCSVIVKRMKSLAFTLSLLSESKDDILNPNANTRNKVPISPFWSCHAHASCAECEICCSCVLKMFVEMHMLAEHSCISTALSLTVSAKGDNVGDNYVAVSNIINGLMRKLVYQNELQKRRKEEIKRKHDGQRYDGRKNENLMSTEEIINWPNDLIDLVENWDSLPENVSNKSLLKRITQNEFNQLTQSILEPPQQNIHKTPVMRGWSINRQAMVARPIIGQINNRALLNRNVIPRPILTHPVNGSGRPLMSQIVAAGRHHIMSQIVAGRPILSRVISGHSLMGHTISAQSLMNHSINGQNILQANPNGAQLLQSHNIVKQLNHNLTFVNYNPSVQSRMDQNTSSNSNNRSQQ